MSSIRFRWDKLTGSFAGHARLTDGTRIEISVGLDYTNDQEILQAQARAALSLLQERLPTICRVAAKQLLKLQNQHWNEGRPATTAKEFVECITLESVAILDGGALTLFFDDGN